MNRLNTMKYTFDFMQGFDLFSSPTRPDRLWDARTHTYVVYVGGSLLGYKGGGGVNTDNSPLPVSGLYDAWSLTPRPLL
jgi:hypothetical protein